MVELALEAVQLDLHTVLCDPDNILQVRYILNMNAAE
jgi:hypothetical protein